MDAWKCSQHDHFRRNKTTDNDPRQAQAKHTIRQAMHNLQCSPNMQWFWSTQDTQRNACMHVHVNASKISSHLRRRSWAHSIQVGMQLGPAYSAQQCLRRSSRPSGHRPTGWYGCMGTHVQWSNSQLGTLPHNDEQLDPKPETAQHSPELLHLFSSFSLFHGLFSLPMLGSLVPARDCTAFTIVFAPCFSVEALSRLIFATHVGQPGLLPETEQPLSDYTCCSRICRATGECVLSIPKSAR